jgi:hypothetical protein
LARLLGLTGCVERPEPAVLLMSLVRPPYYETAPGHDKTFHRMFAQGMTAWQTRIRTK